jgi:ATP adenylyltransferase/5',5'''-P-1,P-4-tetraphosphate phosphorylase II
MSPELLIAHSQLPSLTADGDFADQCHALLLQQKLTWEMLRTNYAGLEQVRLRNLDFEGFDLRLQYNPRRLTSSAAKVDAKSIRERQCFLCPTYLPGHQRALPFNGNYLVLCNPFPILPEHFTISHRDHVAQSIDGTLATLLELSKAMGSRYTVFYNGPKCGASAPDHLHFQAGTKDWMPLERDFDLVKQRWGRVLVDRRGLEVTAVFAPLQNFIAIESSDSADIEGAFEVFFSAYQQLAQTQDEPMLNILSSYDQGNWRVILFPRAKHRPAAFFAEDDSKILFSPASVDLGGVCVLPVERDFDKLTHDQLGELFQEVSLSEDAFNTLAADVQKGLAGL